MPVAAGAETPLEVPLHLAGFVHGADGLGDVGFPAPAGRPTGEHAADQLVRLGRERPGELDLLAVGPLTNLGLALRQDPDALARYRSVVIMGGSGPFPEPGVLREFDANIDHDPHAAKLVFDAPREEVVMVGVNVTSPAILDEEAIDAIAAADTPQARLVSAILPFYLDFYRHKWGRRICSMHDPLAAAILLDPQLRHALARGPGERHPRRGARARLADGARGRRRAGPGDRARAADAGRRRHRQRALPRRPGRGARVAAAALSGRAVRLRAMTRALPALLVLGLLLVPASAAAGPVTSVRGAPGPGPSRYDRVSYERFGPASAKRVLILVPGTQGGAGDFSLVGPEIVRRVPGLQVWAYERRSQAFEDHTGFATGDPDRAFGYYLGGQAIGAQRFAPVAGATVPFVREWGLEPRARGPAPGRPARAPGRRAPGDPRRPLARRVDGARLRGVGLRRPRRASRPLRPRADRRRAPSARRRASPASGGNWPRCAPATRSSTCSAPACRGPRAC